MRPTILVPTLVFLLSPALAWPGGLSLNSGVAVNGNTCDQLLWNDASGRPREADIVQLAGNPGGNTGGYITRIGYNDGVGAVTCNESGYAVDGTLSGLGQMVNHGGSGNGWVCSNLDGIKAGASTTVLFQGANHAIYQVDMDEYGDNGNHALGTWHDRWIYFVANGRDDIVESLSYDFSAHPAGYWGYAGINSQVGHDSRSPYCSFNWTGTGSANTFSEPIDGIEYAVADPSGNPYRFQTVGSSPFSAGYTFNAPAANIPYTLQWKNSPDREIGYVSTFDMTQFAAGGGFTSAVNIGSTSSAMPPNWGINYQSNGFQGWMGDKMTWQVPYGAAGGATGGSTFPDWTYSKNWTGYPTMGYTVLIHLGTHSSAGVRVDVAEQAAIHALPANAFSAAVGTIPSSGQENLQDSVGGFTFKPAGFNHIYDAWEATCAGNAADVTLTLGAAALSHPTFIFDAFNAALCQLTLNGVVQVEGTDLFSSLDTVNHRLYVTFNKALTGSERIVVSSVCGSPTPTPTPTASPTPGAATATPAATSTPASGGSGKQYCLTVDYSAVPALLNDRKLTLNLDVGHCVSVQATEDGSPIAAVYNAGTGMASLTVSSPLSLSSVMVTAVGWTSGGSGAVTKAPLYGNDHFAVSQTFDDGLLSPYTNAKTLLDAHGWRAGCAVVGKMQDNNYSNYMSWAQLQALRAAGWAMYNHTYDHPTVTCANFSSEFTLNQNDFLTEFPGYHVNHIVYPYEVVSADTCLGFPPGFLISGEAATGATETFVDAPLPNVYTAERSGEYGMDPTAWEAQVTTTAANSRPGWNIFITHEVLPGSTDPATLSNGLGPYSTNVNALTAFYNYVDSNYGPSGNGNLWFAPAGEVMDYLMTRDNAVVTAFACGTPTPSPTACAACSPTATFTNSPTASPSPTATPLPACSGNVIDELDTAGPNAYGGYWYDYATSPSTISPSAWALTSPGLGGTGSCARINGTFVTGAYVGLGTGLATGGSNLSAYAGISFWAKGDGATYSFAIHSLVEGSGTNDYHYNFMAPAAWTLITIPWASFSFPGWGTNYAFDDTQITQLGWAPVNTGAYDLSVDSVHLLCPVPTPSPSPTPGAVSPSASPTQTASPSASSTATPTGTSSGTATVTVTPSPTTSSTATPSGTASATSSASPSTSPTVSPTFTDVPPGSTPTDTPTSSPTFSVSPSGTTALTVSASPSASPSATPSASPTETASPSALFTATPTGTSSSTATATPSPSPTSTVSPGATATETASASPSALPSATVTPWSTRSASPSPTVSLTPSVSSGVWAPGGALCILEARFYPNPNPQALALRLAGPADRIAIKVYSEAENRVLTVEGGACPGGWVRIGLPPTWSAGLPSGVYYARVQASRGDAVSAPVKPISLLLLH